MSGLDLSGALGHDRSHQERVVELGAQVEAVRVEAACDRAGIGSGGNADAAWLFQRERAGDAIAEVRGIGRNAPASITAVFTVVCKVARGWIGVEVEERLGKTEGEPCELDESAVGIKALRRGRIPGVTKRDISAHNAVVGLLASIHRDHPAGAHGEIGLPRADAVQVEPARGAAVIIDVRPEERRCGHVLTVVVVELLADISTELEADIGVGNVGEAIPIQIADLDVCHCCLLRHIGSLRAGDRTQPCGSTEQETR
jgi:hypothetical protein